MPKLLSIGPAPHETLCTTQNCKAFADFRLEVRAEIEIENGGKLTTYEIDCCDSCFSNNEVAIDCLVDDLQTELDAQQEDLPEEF